MVVVVGWEISYVGTKRLGDDLQETEVVELAIVRRKTLPEPEFEEEQPSSDQQLVAMNDTNTNDASINRA